MLWVNHPENLIDPVELHFFGLNSSYSYEVVFQNFWQTG